MTDSITKEVGFDIAGLPGMREAEVQTPCLIIDLDHFEYNLKRMASIIKPFGVSLRAHAKMHKSVDVARRQQQIGGASGICCQKVSEAETFARAGITDILITNQICDPVKISRLAAIAASGCRISVCVDDLNNIAALSAAAMCGHTEIRCLVEVDCGSGRCGVSDPDMVVRLAHSIDKAEGLRFEGIQAYHGNIQHEQHYHNRSQVLDEAFRLVQDVIDHLTAAELPPQVVSGGGTGSFLSEAGSGIYTEIQCGSYAFMDADYGRILNQQGDRLDEAEWRNALFLLTSVMSVAVPGQAVCDAGLKVQSVDSGLPVIAGHQDIEYITCSDEHGVIRDAADRLQINDRLRLIPGHCDPTCNLHDWYICVRNGVVEEVWPVSARGKAF